MTKGFKDSLSPELVKHVLAQCGRTGEGWFSQLSTTIETLERLWSLNVQEPFPSIEYNFVAPVTCENGESAVLKISPPFEQIEIFGEADYLRSRGGEGAVRLIAESREHRAILIEHAWPGKNLAELFTGNEEMALGAAISMLHTVLRPVPVVANDVTKLNEWFDGLRRYPYTAFPADYAGKALAIYDELGAQPDRIFYLHGDYHPGNIVNATRSPFLVIDPKGIIGHIGYEIAVFLNNYHWWQERLPDVRDRVAAAVTEFSAAFGLDPVELRKWAFAQMVLSAWWNFYDAPQLYQGEVVKADIWDV